MAVEGSTTREIFEAYLKQVLVPSESGAGRGDGQPLCSQGLSGKRADRGAGCELLYLPPYSPDLNPIEEAFAKLKVLLRRAGARSREALIEAMGRSLDAVTASDARGFFEHRGYHATAQPVTEALMFRYLHST